jgi:hypothetical protein
MFRQHFAESAMCCFGVQFVFQIGLSLLSECCRFQGPSYLLNVVSIILEKGREKFQLLGEEILLTKSHWSVYQICEDCLQEGDVSSSVGMGGLSIDSVTLEAVRFSVDVKVQEWRWP